MKVSFFTSLFEPKFYQPNAPKGRQNIHYPLASVALTTILGFVSDGRYENDIERIKNGFKQKTSLPCFTPSGQFRIRTDAELLEYSGIICLDYDNLPSVVFAKQIAIKEPYTFGVFISPSLQGLKVFVCTHGNAKNHKENYKEIAAYYDAKLGAKHDPKCSNLSRLCFVSSDRDTYINADAKPYPLEAQKPQIKRLPSLQFSTNLSFDNLAKRVIASFTNQKISYAKGNINDWIFLFACNCNRFGIDLNTAKNWVADINERGKDQQRPQVPLVEAERAYSLYVQEHGTKNLQALKNLKSK